MCNIQGDQNLKEIVCSNHRYIRVLAGPGTGKTYSMIRRVKRIIEEGVSPKKIMICTFTRTAANDIRRELDRLGVRGLDQIEAGTLHSFCFKFLQKNNVLSITQRHPRPLMNFEERFLLEDISNNFGNITKRKKRLEAFKAAWARLQTDDPGWPSDPEDTEFQEEIIDWLRFHQAMLIGELVPETLKFLRHNPTYNPGFKHVLVDEYQDLNKAEQVLIDKLSENGNLFIIGDDNQSIYSFKYAHPEGIRNFPLSHEDTQDIQLNISKRCPRKIVSIANSLISHNRDSDVLLISSDDSEDGEIYIVQWNDDVEESEGLAKFIKHKIISGEVEPGKILVLSPRRLLGYAIRDRLRELGVPVKSFFQEEALEGDPKKIDKSKAQQAFTLLSLLANPNDRVALRSWCGFGSPSLRKNPWNRLRSYCISNHESPREVLEKLLSRTIKIPHTNRIVERYKELKNHERLLSELRGEDLLNKLFPEEEWANPIRALVPETLESDYDAKTLFENLRYQLIQPELPTEVDYVRVMSLHKAKGLTADLVIVTGCVEGLIPNEANSTEETEDIREEQRRLFYVAITRAKKILVISSFTTTLLKKASKMHIRQLYGHHRRNSEVFVKVLASSFIDELGPNIPDAINGRVFLSMLNVE